jgi:RNA 3'-terminal phosphate cyclase (ATP)
MIEIDGSYGEGGGQIIRTSLALSLVTGKAFRVARVRARRDPPGLKRQHLTAVNAAAEVGRARVEGARVGSQQAITASLSARRARRRSSSRRSCRR